MHVAGKTVLLTGATGGLGRAVAAALAARGARMLLSSRKQEELDRLAANAPELASRLAGDLAARISDQVAAGQTDKR
jgi:NADP-dependent 3-hydroxy acid dehydrogenase YdfG